MEKRIYFVWFEDQTEVINISSMTRSEFNNLINEIDLGGPNRKTVEIIAERRHPYYSLRDMNRDLNGFIKRERKEID